MWRLFAIWRKTANIRLTGLTAEHRVPKASYRQGRSSVAAAPAEVASLSYRGAKNRRSCGDADTDLLLAGHHGGRKTFVFIYISPARLWPT